jgi:hypothetical protein
MSSEKTIRVKKLRIIAEELVIEPGRIIIKRPQKKKEGEEDLWGFEER